MLPCTLEGCGRPRPDKWVTDILALYESCRDRRALPYGGGVMDQPAELMNWFRLIDKLISRHKEKQKEQEHRQWPTSQRT